MTGSSTPASGIPAETVTRVTRIILLVTAGLFAVHAVLTMLFWFSEGVGDLYDTVGTWAEIILLVAALVFVFWWYNNREKVRSFIAGGGLGSGIANATATTRNWWVLLVGGLVVTRISLAMYSGEGGFVDFLSFLMEAVSAAAIALALYLAVRTIDGALKQPG